ncbi:hypothetical protein BpHYR1_023074, partial [Brachionus plicatilis]
KIGRRLTISHLAWPIGLEVSYNFCVEKKSFCAERFEIVLNRNTKSVTSDMCKVLSKFKKKNVLYSKKKKVGKKIRIGLTFLFLTILL